MTDSKPKPRGFLRKNDRKTEDWHADYRGSIKIPEGLPAGEYWADMWLNTGDDGSKYLTYQIGGPKAPREPGDDDHKGDPSAPAPAPRGASGAAEFSDDIPFSPW